MAYQGLQLRFTACEQEALDFTQSPIVTSGIDRFSRSRENTPEGDQGLSPWRCGATSQFSTCHPSFRKRPEWTALTSGMGI
jgi:hypothetical protein